jgi:hypothetical protein
MVRVDHTVMRQHSHVPHHVAHGGIGTAFGVLGIGHVDVGWCSAVNMVSSAMPYPYSPGPFVWSGRCHHCSDVHARQVSKYTAELEAACTALNLQHSADKRLWSVSRSQVYLDPKDRNTTEYKTETFAGVYKKLTGKDIAFEFPMAESA